MRDVYKRQVLDTALSEEEKKVSRRSELTESLPKTEKALKERDKDISNRNIALEADKALLSEKKKQRDADKESLRFDSIAEAQSKSDALGKTVSEMKKAYDLSLIHILLPEICFKASSACFSYPSATSIRISRMAGE